MPVQIDITRVAGQMPEPLDFAELAQRAVDQCLMELGMPKAETELSIVLMDDETIRGLNDKWRGQAKPTNVLSFPAIELDRGAIPGPLLGDIVLSIDTTAREAIDNGISFSDHISHLVIHGLLHLLGYDHENDADAEQMESIEKVVLEQMGIKDPYSD